MQIQEELFDLNKDWVGAVDNHRTVVLLATRIGVVICLARMVLSVSRILPIRVVVNTTTFQLKVNTRSAYEFWLKLDTHSY